MNINGIILPKLSNTAFLSYKRRTLPFTIFAKIKQYSNSQYITITNTILKKIKGTFKY